MVQFSIGNHHKSVPGVAYIYELAASQMKTILTILSFIVLTQLKAQTIDKNYIVNWIKSIDTTYQPDSVIAYHIDRDSYYTYDTLDFNSRLRQIDISRLKSIYYSEVKMDNYVPGKGTFYISTIKKQEISNIKNWLTRAKKLFVDNYLEFSEYIFTNPKDPVLYIDNREIFHDEIKETLKNLDPKDIYDIDVSSSPVPATIYGRNSKNGLVQIWTKKLFNE
jgi:hypothetical protein